MSENFKLEKIYINKIVNKINNIQNQFDLLSSLNQIGGNDSLKKAYISKITKRLDNIIKSSQLLNNFNKVIYQFGGSSIEDDSALQNLQAILSKKDLTIQDADRVNIYDPKISEVTKTEYKAVQIDIEKINKELQELILKLKNSISELKSRLETDSELKKQLKTKTSEYENLFTQISTLKDDLLSKDRENETLVKDIKSKEVYINSKDNEIESLKGEIKNLKEEIESLKDLSAITKQVEEYYNLLLKCQNKDKQPITQPILDINSVNNILKSKYNEYANFEITKKEIQQWSKGNQDNSTVMKTIYSEVQKNIDNRYNNINNKLSIAKEELNNIEDKDKEINDLELDNIKENLNQIKENASKYKLTKEQDTLKWSNINNNIDVINLLKAPVIYSPTFESNNDKKLINNITSNYEAIIANKDKTLTLISTKFEEIKSEYSKLNADIDSFNNYINTGNLLFEDDSSKWIDIIKANEAGKILSVN